MACVLQRDPTFGCDFIAPTGSTPTVGVRINAPENLLAANYNDADLSIANDKKCSFTTVKGPAVVALTIAAPDTARVQIVEYCGGGDSDTRVLRDFTFDQNDPVKLFTIRGQ